MDLIKERKQQASNMLRVLVLCLLLAPAVGNAKLRYYHKTDKLEEQVAELYKAMNELQQEVDQLKLEVKALKKGSKKVGLKVKDMNHQSVHEPSRSISSSQSLSAEEANDMMEKIKQIKNRQQESQKIIDQIMNDDY